MNYISYIYILYQVFEFLWFLIVNLKPYLLIVINLYGLENENTDLRSKYCEVNVLVKGTWKLF